MRGAWSGAGSAGADEAGPSRIAIDVHALHEARMAADLDDVATQNALHRYPRSPRDSRTPTMIDGAPEPRDPSPSFVEFENILLRASFQRAIVNSGKQLVVPGRIGLSGYSAGGPATYAALRSSSTSRGTTSAPSTAVSGSRPRRTARCRASTRLSRSS